MNLNEKGKRFEREIARRLSSMFDTDIRRTPNSGGLSLKGDIMTIQEGPLKSLHFELKFHESLNIWKALSQAESDCRPGKIPVVIFKRSRSSVYVCLGFDNFFNILKESEDMKLLYKEQKKPTEITEWEKEIGSEVTVERDTDSDGYTAHFQDLKFSKVPKGVGEIVKGHGGTPDGSIYSLCVRLAGYHVVWGIEKKMIGERVPALTHSLENYVER